MAARTPLTRITLGAASVADDLGYVALADLARALGGLSEDYRVIGGHMVTVLAARWQLGQELYRETGDVDLGIPPIVARGSVVAGSRSWQWPGTGAVTIPYRCLPRIWP
jgi:hypothetical protein